MVSRPEDGSLSSVSWKKGMRNNTIFSRFLGDSLDTALDAALGDRSTMMEEILNTREQPGGSWEEDQKRGHTTRSGLVKHPKNRRTSC